MRVVSQHYCTFPQIRQPATYRSYHTLSPNESRITSATVFMFSTYRLVPAPPSHSFLLLLCFVLKTRERDVSRAAH